MEIGTPSNSHMLQSIVFLLTFFFKLIKMILKVLSSWATEKQIIGADMAQVIVWGLFIRKVYKWLHSYLSNIVLMIALT